MEAPIAPQKAAERLFKDFVPEWQETYVKTNNKPSEQRAKEINMRLHLLPWFGGLALRTGMRPGELIGLDWSDVDFSRRQITVKQSIIRGEIGSPKNNRVRHIPMTDELCKALAYRRRTRGLVFTRPDNTPLSYSIAWNAIRRHCKHSGLRMIGWHVLRHTFASQLASEGVPVPAIQQLLGYATTQMTMRYSHLAPSVLRDAVARLEVAEKNAQPNFGQPVGNPDKILSEIFR